MLHYRIYVSALGRVMQGPQGRRGRVHRDNDLFEVLDEVHCCPYVVQYVVQYVTYHARRAADVQKCKASRRGAIVSGFSGRRGRV